jgi:hypothetical protein
MKAERLKLLKEINRLTFENKAKSTSEKKSRTEKHEAAAPEQLRLPGF